MRDKVAIALSCAVILPLLLASSVVGATLAFSDSEIVSYNAEARTDAIFTATGAYGGSAVDFITAWSDTEALAIKGNDEGQEGTSPDLAYMDHDYSFSHVLRQNLSDANGAFNQIRMRSYFLGDALRETASSPTVQLNMDVRRLKSDATANIPADHDAEVKTFLTLPDMAQYDGGTIVSHGFVSVYHPTLGETKVTFYHYNGEWFIDANGETIASGSSFAAYQILFTLPGDENTPTQVDMDAFWELELQKDIDAAQQELFDEEFELKQEWRKVPWTP